MIFTSCGWGFLLIEAAKKYKAHGLGITLSKEQYEKCQKRIKEEGVEEFVGVKLLDYRDLRFYTLDVEDLRRHYNKTLLCWNENFQKNRSQVVEMFDERFARMWEMYLCACAATFMNGVIGLHQILFSNDVNNEVPMVRWY